MTNQSISVPQYTASVNALIAEVTSLNSFEEVRVGIARLKRRWTKSQPI
jgi:hypothetical protein